MSYKKYLIMLKDILKQIITVINIINSHKSCLNNHEKIKAQYFFKSLKIKLKEEYKRVNLHRLQNKLDFLELKYYKPAINEAYLFIKPIRANSVPENKWLSFLGEAKTSIECHINKMVNSNEYKSKLNSN